MNKQDIIRFLDEIENDLIQDYKNEEKIALFNQKKVLDEFRKNNVAVRHFSATEGYGYDDIGRDTLCKVYAGVFGTESAIVSPNIVSGTHALTLAMFGVLRPNDTLLCICGEPYDTLHDTIQGKNIGSLNDFGVKYEKIDLNNGKIDLIALKNYLNCNKARLVYIQRSRGYELRDALSIEDIENACKIVKQLSPESIIMTDNCYGEFIDEKEPTQVGCDLVVGSLIKNIGGGLAPTGGYISGKQEYVDLIANRLTSPSIGMEVGSYAAGYRLFYQGLFMAPHVVLQAKKAAMLFAAAFDKLGYEVLPKPRSHPNDIICSIKFNDKEKLIKFCQNIQYCSPIDSNVTPFAWDMPGYADQVIMAAGCFVGGASIEMSCDSPIRPPYVAYLQGALTYEHAKIALMQILESL